MLAKCNDENGTNVPTLASSGANLCQRRATGHRWQPCLDGAAGSVAAADETTCELVATGNSWLPAQGAKCLKGGRPANVTFNSRRSCEREGTGNTWYSTTWLDTHDRCRWRS